MKYLKYLLGLIALLALIFFGRGLMTPNVSYSTEITVDKPVAEAWAVMNDQSKTKDWLKDLTEIEHVSGERNTVGAVTRYTFEQNGESSTILETLKAFTENEHVAMDFDMEGVMHMDYQMNLSEENGKTRIQSATVTTGEGLFMRSMVSFMKGSMLAQENENLNNLKTLINTNTTDYFPEPEPAPVANEAVEATAAAAEAEQE